MSKTIRFLLLFTVLHLCAMSFTGCERQVIISPGTPSPTNSLPNNTEIIDNLLENEIWNEGKWLIEKLGKTAIEIDDSYSEWTFVGCINGWNYFMSTRGRFFCVLGRLTQGEIQINPILSV